MKIICKFSYSDDEREYPDLRTAEQELEQEIGYACDDEELEENITEVLSDVSEFCEANGYVTDLSEVVDMCCADQDEFGNLVFER